MKQKEEMMKDLLSAREDGIEWIKEKARRRNKNRIKKCLL